MAEVKNGKQEIDRVDGLSLFEKAYQGFVREHENAQLDLTKKILAAQSDFRLGQIGDNQPDDLRASGERCVEAVRATWRDWQAACKSAHDGFVGGVADAWRRTSPDQLDPNGLIAIANGLSVVAAQSAAVLGSLDLFAATGVAPPEDVYPASAVNPNAAQAN
jgi:hypothetical protein